MERDEIPKTLCRSGCGFYGSSATDGLCSVCFKEALKKKCVPTSVSTGSSSSAGGATASVQPPPPDQPPVVPIGGDQSTTNTTATVSAIIDVSQSSSPPPGTSTSKAQPSEEEEDKKPGKTKNRCDTCRKKIGLTGFDCRCGGRFCAIHRYSDLHECSFNYREMGQDEIRKNNPQIRGQKINKI